MLFRSIGLLVFLAFFMQTLLVNLLGFFTGALEHQSATVLVYGEDARRSLEGSVVTPEQVDAVGRVDGVGASGPLGERSFTVRADGKEVDAILFGYDLGGPGAPTRLASGTLPQRDGEGVGSAIDADLGFGLGDTVEVLPGGDGTGTPLPIRIVGTAEESRFSVLPTVFVSFATYERAARTANPNATTDTNRYGLHLSYVLDWLTPEEAGPLSTDWDRVRSLPERAQRLLGWRSSGNRDRFGARLWTVDYEDVPVGLGLID